MSSTPELALPSPPRRRPSAAALHSPSCNTPISRSNTSSSTLSTNTTTTMTTSTTDKKRPRSEEHLNNLPEDSSPDPDQTVIHSPRTYTPPLTQSPGKAARGTDSRGPHRVTGSGSGDNRPRGESDREGSRRGSVSCSPDRTIMPPPSSGWVSGNRRRSDSPEGIIPTPLPVIGGDRVEENDPITPTEEEVGDESNESIDDLLVQLPDYDWPGFVSRFSETLKEVGAEKERLSMEHDMWNWMYEIWSSSRDRDDTRRLSREMATIIQWTKLKEVDLENAREAHTQSMLAISSVLGIAPKNATPPPSVVKKKRVQR